MIDYNIVLYIGLFLIITGVVIVNTMNNIDVNKQ